MTHIRNSAAALIFSALTLTGCSNASQSKSSTLGEGENHPGRDVSVLQAWIGDDVAVSGSGDSSLSAKYNLKTTNCRVLERHTYPSSSGGTYDYVTGDCTSAIERAAKLPNFEAVSPMLGDARFEWEESSHGTYTHTGKCELVEFRTVTANAVLEQGTFTGFGFYIGGAYYGGEHFVEKARLHKVGDVTLADGRPGTVHRFIAQGFCFGLGGNGDSIYHRQYNFKPFARFVSNGQTYNVWDDVADYFLGRQRAGAWIQNFDRQNELLKQ